MWRSGEPRQLLACCAVWGLLSVLRHICFPTTWVIASCNEGSYTRIVIPTKQTCYDKTRPPPSLLPMFVSLFLLGEYRRYPKTLQLLFLGAVPSKPSFCRPPCGPPLSPTKLILCLPPQCSTGGYQHSAGMKNFLFLFVFPGPNQIKVDPSI